MLATTPSPGPYPARELARSLDPRCVDDDLGAAIRVALDAERGDYRSRAAALLEPYSTRGVDRVVAQEVLPRLLTGWQPRASRSRRLRAPRRRDP